MKKEQLEQKYATLLMQYGSVCIRIYDAGVVKGKLESEIVETVKRLKEITAEELAEKKRIEAEQAAQVDPAINTENVISINPGEETEKGRS